MTDILLLSILLVLLGAFALSILVFIRVKAVFLSFVTSPGENQPSALAKTFEFGADMIARALMAQAKTFLMGIQSGEAKREQMEVEAGNPLLSLVPRNLRRNPLANILTQFLAAKLGGYKGLPGDNHQNAPVEAPKFKL